MMETQFYVNVAHALFHPYATMHPLTQNDAIRLHTIITPEDAALLKLDSPR
jgi:hypothetical protein